MMSIALALGSILPWIPRGLADKRIANAVYRRAYEDGESTMVQATVGGARFSLDIADWPQAQAVMLRRYDPETVEFVVHHLPPRGTYVEAGGHVGLIALQVAVGRPDVTVHVFEPHPTRSDSLRANLALNPRDNVVINRCGLSDSSGTLRFDSRSHSIRPDGDVEVPVVALDGYAAEHGIACIDVLKLDVEGHELAALEGAERLFREGRVHAVTMEVTHPAAKTPNQFVAERAMKEIPMPDLRPRWVQALRRQTIENVGYVRILNQQL